MKLFLYLFIVKAYLHKKFGINLMMFNYTLIYMP